jgi:hypothetical protein
LQVAIKVTQEDEATISMLQTQAADSKMKEILALRNAQEASDMITSLNFEINLLKRKLKIAEADKQGTIPGTSSNEMYQMSYAAADSEVDAMLGGADAFGATRFVEKQIAESATPFERWKMNQFLYSPDTPAASEQYDKEVVLMLLEASQQDFNDDFRKPTKAGIAKMKKSGTWSTGTTLKPLTGTGSRPTPISVSAAKTGTIEGGANIYETMGVGFLEAANAPSYSAVGGPRRNQDDKIYFLDKVSSTSMWGGGAANHNNNNNSSGNNLSKSMQLDGFGGGVPSTAGTAPGFLSRSTSNLGATLPTKNSNNNNSNNNSMPGTSPPRPAAKKSSGINSMIV